MALTHNMAEKLVQPAQDELLLESLKTMEESETPCELGLFASSDKKHCMNNAVWIITGTCPDCNLQEHINICDQCRMLLLSKLSQVLDKGDGEKCYQCNSPAMPIVSFQPLNVK